MPLISLVITLIVVGVLLWLINRHLGAYIAPPILQIINVVVVIFVVLWLLQVFGIWGGMADIRVGGG